MDKEIQYFLNYLAVEKGFSLNTVAAYKNDLSQLAAFVQENFPTPQPQWSQVDRSLVLSYILSLKEKEYAPATLARKVAAVRSFFNFLAAEAGTKANPLDGIASPRGRGGTPSVTTSSESRWLLTTSISLTSGL